MDASAWARLFARRLAAARGAGRAMVGLGCAQWSGIGMVSLVFTPS
jgi:hypothetical protein